MEKLAIISAIHQSFDTTHEFVNNLSETDFVKHLPEKWHAGQQLEHLNKAIKPFNFALKMPKTVIQSQFGEANRASKTYDELVETYLNKLSTTQVSTATAAMFKPEEIISKQDVITEFTTQKDELLQNIEIWNEEELDKYILPHPLLGKLTVREMLYFTIYHNYHHLELMKKNLA